MAGVFAAGGKTSARRVEPEWLDALPPSDPRAVRSRRDLERINAIMRHAPLLERLLASHAARPPERLIEIGGGDGKLLLAVARRLRWRGVAATLVDPRAEVAGATREGFASLGWRLEVALEDAETHLRRAGAAADAVVANLFLHHLEDDALRRLFALIANAAPLFACCEPRRAGAAAAASRLLWAIGCNDVSRHDAVVSVRAGFAGRELSECWPQGPWRLEERRAGLFTHAFVAARADSRAADPADAAPPCATTRS
ncbi:MAG TPA: methyltransferase domain-containing protein [Gammaproteobacteria bacterium]|nr:methyltransferase domain-containing protein [Gammaproteobacteria bacterium]